MLGRYRAGWKQCRPKQLLAYGRICSRTAISQHPAILEALPVSLHTQSMGGSVRKLQFTFDVSKSLLKSCDCFKVSFCSGGPPLSQSLQWMPSLLWSPDTMPSWFQTGIPKFSWYAKARGASFLSGFERRNAQNLWLLSLSQLPNVGGSWKALLGHTLTLPLS